MRDRRYFRWRTHGKGQGIGRFVVARESPDVRAGAGNDAIGSGMTSTSLLMSRDTSPYSDYVHANRQRYIPTDSGS
ncbi:hypothetical protein J6590_056209 [Homalodisca vitripennis]|nr:hypothetical protein J6590_056209 [Homalodisca vitripennis]